MFKFGGPGIAAQIRKVVPDGVDGLAGGAVQNELAVGCPRRGLCGQYFPSVLVNFNGNLTFGGGDLDWIETVAESLKAAGAGRSAASPLA